MKIALLFAALVGVMPLMAQPTPKEAMQRLLAGNERYITDRLEHPNRDQDRRDAIAAKQEPFAVIVGCSDSRVSPEILFDQGVGDLFVVRVAGNVVGPLEMDSIEYAVKVLHSVAILVLGHESCGAVDAVMKGQTADIEAVAELIAPAAEEAKQRGGNNLLKTATEINAKRMAHSLLDSPLIAQLVKEQKLLIQSGYYNLQSGKVDILDAGFVSK